MDPQLVIISEWQKDCTCSVLASLEEKVAEVNGEGTVRKRVNREYTYFRIRGNHEQTGTM